MNILTEILQEQKEQWRRINEPVGKLLGYPDCCIKEFCEQTPLHFKMHLPTDNDRIRLEASYIGEYYTGFIPCAFHARQIREGKITLQSLIGNRSPQFLPFPSEWDRQQQLINEITIQEENKNQ